MERFIEVHKKGERHSLSILHSKQRVEDGFGMAIVRASMK